MIVRCQMKTFSSPDSGGINSAVLTADTVRMPGIVALNLSGSKTRTRSHPVGAIIIVWISSLRGDTIDLVDRTI